MKRVSSTSADISDAVLATQYLALQQLRERVRQAEELLASTRLKKGPFLQRTPEADTPTLPKSRNW